MAPRQEEMEDTADLKGQVARIVSLNHRGEGVGRAITGPDKGLVVFLPGTLPEDTVEYSVVERKKDYVRGQVTRFLEMGPGRVEPACPVASQCGGCMWQHIDYQFQLDWKRRLVEEALLRIARIDYCPVNPCIPSPRVFGYRNKVEVPLALKRGKIVYGFYRPYSHEVVPSDTCLLEHPLAREVISGMIKYVNRMNYSVYNEITGRGQVRHVVARVAPGTGQRMAVFVANVHNLPRQFEMARELASELPGLESVVLNINTEKTNVILGDREKLLYGNWHITDVLGSDWLGRLKFRISPRSFYQVNSDQAVVLYEQALKACELTDRDVVYDIYSGIGTITLFAALKAHYAVGIEEVGPAVRDARRNARNNGIDNVEFREGKAERILPSVRVVAGRPSVVILDPPRGGAEKEALHAIARFEPRAIVYVSCNPATLARDLLVLSQFGWRLEWCQPVDMFPMTPHVECVASIRR